MGSDGQYRAQSSQTFFVLLTACNGLLNFTSPLSDFMQDLDLNDTLGLGISLYPIATIPLCGTILSPWHHGQQHH